MQRSNSQMENSSPCLDHDDLIEPDMLYRVVEALNVTPEADVLYFDEDRVARDGDHYEQPFFKPGWSPELLLSVPFPMHGVIRRQRFADVGGFHSETDGTQDWDLFLRVSEVTTRFVHIPRVLYHWRKVEGAAAAAPDAKPYVWDLQLAVVRRHLERMGRTEAKSLLAMPGIIRVVWPIEPLTVSIIIPTKDKADILRRCLDSIAARTVYESYEIFSSTLAAGKKRRTGIMLAWSAIHVSKS